MRPLSSLLRVLIPVAVLALAGCMPTTAIVGPAGDEEFVPGDAVEFAGVADDPLGGPIAQWHWDFGDGHSETTGTGAASHAYCAPGTYLAALTVTTADGRTSTCLPGACCSVPIRIYPVPCVSSSGTDCRARFTVSEKKVRYWRSHPLGTPNPDITRAVIVQHGNSRNADGYFGYMVEAAIAEGLIHSTLILAVNFITLEDSPAADEIYWSSSGWKKGDPSLNGPGLSSFDVMDHVFAELVAPGRFPGIEEIVIAGHSAGGQFVNRFAGGSGAEEDLAGVDVRYVVANPSSYMYLNESRRVAGHLDLFEVPDPGEIDCPFSYNDYKYGLNERNEYMSRLTGDGIRARYTGRDVVYLLGTEDDDPQGSGLDRSCPAMLQGDHRLMRGTVFYNNLCEYFDCSNHDFVPVQGVGHSGRGMFTSDEGRGVIFGATR